MKIFWYSLIFLGIGVAANIAFWVYNMVNFFIIDVGMGLLIISEFTLLIALMISMIGIYSELTKKEDDNEGSKDDGVS